MPFTDRHYLDVAARLAVRGTGRVEPGAVVGAVIVKDGRIIGMGHHRAIGRLHAEADALTDCRARNHDPAGATVYVTLEPCAKPGQNPPCAAALIDARVARVVCARRDPNPLKAGGADLLAKAGIDCDFNQTSRAACWVGEPFVKRITTGLPWVIAKWAQTIDGKIATRTGESQWISSDRSRLRVHRLRATVDAIITGIGTVTADDPLLTARGVPIRRVAKRIVVDGAMRTPLGSKLVRTAKDFPLIIACTADSIRQRTEHGNALRDAGATLLPVPDTRGLLDLHALLKSLTGLGVSTAMLECGPTLMGAMLQADLIDEMQVYIGPLLMADDEAPGPTNDGLTERLSDARRFNLATVRQMGPDVRLNYRRALGF